MPEEPTAKVWKALSDPTRREILDLLRERPRATGELADCFPSISRFAVMTHLRILEAAELVVTRKEGKRLWNHLNAVPLRQAYERYVSRFDERSAAGLIALKKAVEAKGILTMREINIEQDITIAAAPDAVWQSLTEGIGDWWFHTFQGGRVRLEAHPGGRFFEEFPGGGGLYATVTYCQPPNELCMVGPMGLKGAVTGAMRFVLEGNGDSTTLKVSHALVGQVTEEHEQGYTQGWKDLLGGGLKPHSEGRPQEVAQ
jgi:DNA-binding transcriptional ArsR family regulator